MQNQFLNRINTLYNELIAQDRLKFDGLNYFVKNRQTRKWAIAKVLKGDIISAPTSRGTSCPLSNIRFMLNHPGPYTIDMPKIENARVVLDDMFLELKE